jgi:predicted GIY-YIG superfamily endonuclease
MKIFKLYVLESTDHDRTYVGVTKDLKHRLRQHNRELAGGARSTAGRKWRVAATLDGFSSDGAALGFEKSMHNKGKRWKPLLWSATGDGEKWATVLERRLGALRDTIAATGDRRGKLVLKIRRATS